MINAFLNWLIRAGVQIIFDLIKWESSVTKYCQVHCGKAEHLQLSFCRHRYCLTLLNPPMRQCSLFSVLPNIQVVAVSSMLPGFCLDTSYVFPENKSLHYFYVYYLILKCSHLVNKVKLTTISLSLKKITGVIFTCTTYLIASNLRIVLLWTLDKMFCFKYGFCCLGL